MFEFFPKKLIMWTQVKKVLACSKPFLGFPETKIFCTHFQGGLQFSRLFSILSIIGQICLDFKEREKKRI